MSETLFRVIVDFSFSSIVMNLYKKVKMNRYAYPIPVTSPLFSILNAKLIKY